MKTIAYITLAGVALAMASCSQLQQQQTTVTPPVVTIQKGK